ncbi:cytochrome P450 [Mycena latifolia]|nr:cytochrome P450 [Mycena latifolia]
MEISPGIRFLSRPFAIILLLFIAGYAAKIPPHLVSFKFALLGVPTYTGLHIWAARVLHFDILADLRRNWNVSYLLEVLRELLVAPHTHTVNLRIGWEGYNFTTEPEYIKIILATDFSSYVKSDALRECMGSVLCTHPDNFVPLGSLLGTGVFNSDGEIWKFHRAATRPFFTSDRISDFEIFACLADCAIGRMKEGLRAGHADLANRFTLDSTTSFLFGSCVDSLAAPLPYPATVSVAVIHHISSRFGWVWPLLELSGNTARVPMRVVDAYLAPIMRSGTAERETLLDELLDELLYLTSDPKVLKDEMCVASHLTPNSSLPGSTSSSARTAQSQYPPVTHAGVHSEARHHQQRTHLRRLLVRAPTFLLLLI